MFKHNTEILIKTSATQDLILKAIWQIFSVENDLTDFHTMPEYSIKQWTFFHILTYSSPPQNLMCGLD